MDGPRPPVPYATNAPVNAAGTLTVGGMDGLNKIRRIFRGFALIHR